MEQTRLNNSALLPALASHFVFHPCLTVEDYGNRSDREYVALYVHHFFPDASKCTAWGDDFKVRTIGGAKELIVNLQIHIHFIPTTFDTYVECEGFRESLQPPSKQPFVKTKNEANVGPDKTSTVGGRTDTSLSIPSQIIQTLETQQGLFPGGFIGSKEEFLALLQPKEHERNHRTVSFSGRAIAQADVNFRDGLGENKVWIIECSLLQNK